MTRLQLRVAGPEDAEQVALLHAASWRRHYRGAYSDAFLDGDVAADRRAVWASRLAVAGRSATAVAEDGAGVVGFVHVVFDDDDQWGSLLDNLHVAYGRQRTGVGTALLRWAAGAVAGQATSRSLHLWVLEQNTPAQRFYQAHGGTPVEKALVAPPGGVPARLTGTPAKLRMWWPDAASLAG